MIIQENFGPTEELQLLWCGSGNHEDQHTLVGVGLKIKGQWLFMQVTELDIAGIRPDRIEESTRLISA